MCVILIGSDLCEASYKKLRFVFKGKMISLSEKEKRRQNYNAFTFYLICVLPCM
jgi:hypothetical protein